ncbi:proline-rich protein 2-like [Macrobrachium rosenbergii]|uniref:proline-rich protein 2-like n=1 Tax=Macrobrachium rosenbergii TaxID=79674 RepID=UPI0034D6E5FE
MTQLKRRMEHGSRLLSLSDFDGSKEARDKLRTGNLPSPTPPEGPQPNCSPLHHAHRGPHRDGATSYRLRQGFTAAKPPQSAAWAQPEEDEQPANAAANRRSTNHSRCGGPQAGRYCGGQKRRPNCLPPCSFARSKNRGGGGQQDKPPWQPKKPGAQKQ